VWNGYGVFSNLASSGELPPPLQKTTLTTGPKLRTERLRKTKIGTEVAHVTCNSDTTFKVKKSKVKVTRPLYSPRR